jgi:hypothetical protein
VPTKKPNEINGLTWHLGCVLSAWADAMRRGIGKANEIKACAVSAIIDTANGVNCVIVLMLLNV